MKVLEKIFECVVKALKRYENALQKFGKDIRMLGIEKIMRCKGLEKIYKNT